MDVRSSRGNSARAGDATPAPAQQRVPRRSRFAAIDDVVLLRVVNDFRPWRAPVGTAFGVMKVFEEIAVECAKDEEFGVQKGGPALRTRFVTLLNQFKSDRCQSMRQAGTSGQFEEREKLLENISIQIEEWNKRSDDDKLEPRESRAQFILRLEKGMKRQAIESAHEEEEEKEAEEQEDDEDQNTAVSVASDVADTTSAECGVLNCTAKRQRIDSVTDALVSAIVSVRDVDKRKIDFEIQKLSFDREMAERQRQHEREESARRREHELALEERRMAVEQRRLEAEEAREQRMHEFILKLLDQQKKS